MKRDLWGITVTGRVQGVGFRPFVLRVARGLGLSGWVRNRLGRVEIRLCASSSEKDAFLETLLHHPPPLARPRVAALESLAAPESVPDPFVILPSIGGDDPEIHLPPDRFACDECLAEMMDPGNRRFHYPFINCTQCGPRWTIIRRLPYDRENTALDAFPLCPDCLAEYRRMSDRRFHAEPTACPRCGPRIVWSGGGEGEAALNATLASLRAGRIVAVKGVGGYHLLCDAAHHPAIVRLREKKPRPDKPLALLCPWRGGDGLAAVRAFARVGEEEGRVLADPERPILLLPKSDPWPLSPAIAPGLNEVGVMLPYSPLHALLAAEFGAPLVATSANPSGEPVLTDAQEAETRLAHVAEGFLHHDRPILRPADDAVRRMIRGRARLLRPGRGVAPLEVEVPFSFPEPLLALGGEMKNTLALGEGRRILLSPHVGDLSTPRALDLLARLMREFPALHGVAPALLLHDRHPGHGSTRLARESGLPTRAILHHHAHASAALAESPEARDGDWLAWTWDGVGLGEEGALWGGETLVGGPGRWRRVATFRPFRLLAPDRAAREPWRSAAALLWEEGVSWGPELARAAWGKGVNTFATSAVGRLFDAAAALVLGVERVSFEGQGPMWLEAMATPCAGTPPSVTLREEGGLLVADWGALLPLLRDEERPPGERAWLFHVALARVMVAQACGLRRKHGVARGVFSGGVFQNRLLSELAADHLEQEGFQLFFPENVPVNDGGLAVGQLLEAAPSPST